MIIVSQGSIGSQNSSAIQSASVDPIEMLRRSSHDFIRRVDLVQRDDLGKPTPCPAFDVGELVRHVIGGEAAYVVLLAGGDADDFRATTAAYVLPDDLRSAARESAQRLVAAFSAPGALDGTVRHPVGEIPVRRLAGMRVTEWLIHGWDLARAIGADESIDSDVAEALYAELSQRAEGLVASGYFQPGRGVPAGASSTERVLDLLGRSVASSS